MASREKNKNISPDEIAARLRGLREKEKLSVRKFGKRYGFSYSLWSDYENGKRRPNMKTIQIICETFGVTPDWIFGTARKLNNPLTEGDIINAAIRRGPTTGGDDKRGKTGTKAPGPGAISTRGNEVSKRKTR